MSKIEKKINDKKTRKYRCPSLHKKEYCWSGAERKQDNPTTKTHSDEPKKDTPRLKFGETVDASA